MRYRCFCIDWSSLFAGLTVSLLIGFGVATSQGQAAELDEIRRRGYIVVGVKDNLRPLGFRDEAGELEGLEIDLAHWLAEQLLGDAEAIVFQPLTNQERLLKSLKFSPRHMLRLTCYFNNFAKACRIEYSHLCQHLTVDFDVGLFQPTH